MTVHTTSAHFTQGGVLPYLDDAACTNIPNTMDGNNLDDILTGLAACRNCPVRHICEDWVGGLPASRKRNILSGVIAGKVWGESKRWLPTRYRKEMAGAYQ